MVADAKITVTFSASEFDFVREILGEGSASLKAQAQASYELERNGKTEKTAASYKHRRDLRERQARIDQLLERLS